MSGVEDLVRPPLTEEPGPPATIILRVFGGRLDGAEQALGAARVRIGHGFENDLVLRGRGTSGCSISIKPEGAQAQVRVLSGSVTLLGVVLAADTAALLPAYVPLHLGEYAVAIGEPGSERWAEVPALIASAAAPVAEAPAAANDVESAEDEAARATAPAKRAAVGGWLMAEGGALRRRLPFVSPIGLIAASVALLAIAGAGPAYQLVETSMTTPTSVSSNLSAAGYRDLSVRRDPLTKGMVIEGRVADEAAVEALRRFVNGRYERVALNVTTAAAAAAAVTELLQSQGIDAEAQAGRSGLVVRSEYMPRDKLAALQARIRRDLPGTGPLRFVVDETRGPRDLQYFFASETYGLASYVDGNPGHIVTADGQYWFAGAMLPTGHRLLAVENGAIRFERDGLVESLQVTAPSAPAAPAVTADPSTPPPTPITNLAGLVAPAPRSPT